MLKTFRMFNDMVLKSLQIMNMDKKKSESPWRKLTYRILFPSFLLHVTIKVMQKPLCYKIYVEVTEIIQSIVVAVSLK